MTRSGSIAGALAALLTVGVFTAPSAAATPPPGPLPGYTITLPELVPLPVDAGVTEVLTGIHENAGYAIEVPPHWNGELVMWTHGYRGNGAELLVDAPSYGLRERFVAQGYAWAASSYDRNGYDVASGVTSTRALALEFADLVGKPARTYLAGVSMGGHIMARSLEEYPGAYDGALPMCGQLGDVALFDYFLDFQLAAGTLAGVRAYPPDDDYATTALPAIYGALGLAPGNPAVPTPAAQQLRAATVLDSGGVRPGGDAAFALWKDFLFVLAIPGTEPTPVQGVALNPGLVAGNIGTDYAPDSPVDLDAGVLRVEPADPDTRESDDLTPVARVDGDPGVPVLSLHNLGDLFVPFAMEQVYAAEVAQDGDAELLVQRAIRSAGHCEFSPVEAGTAWDDLVAWVADGVRPEGDDVLDAKAVTDPAYGCAFSDPAAYAAEPVLAPGTAPELFVDPTRRLFEPCTT